MLAEIKEKTSTVTIKEFSQDGAMIEYNSTGEVKGKYHANHVETADVKMKMDGTNEWESRAMETTKEGDVVMVTGKGTGQQNNFKGELTYMTNSPMTNSPRLNWLNNTKGWVEGMTDMKTNEATIKIYQEKSKTTETVETPMM